MDFNVVSHITILDVRHDNKWFIIQNIGTKEFYAMDLNGDRKCRNGKLTENVGMCQLRPNL
jgi:hypothetical protein